MAIELNDGIWVEGNKPSDDKRLKNGVPYTSVSDVLSHIPITDRPVGQKVVIRISGVDKEYWFKDGVADANLVPFLPETLAYKTDLSNSSEIAAGSPTLTTPSQVNVYYFNGTSLKDVTFPKLSDAVGKEIIIINKGTADVIGHSWGAAPNILILNKQVFSNQAVTKPNNIGKFICDGVNWMYETVNNFELIAEEGKTVVMTVLPDGTPQAEETMELWVYDDTTSPYNLTDLQTNYSTSAGRHQGFEVRCRLLTPPTTYRKESENDSLWIKIEGSNVV